MGQRAKKAAEPTLFPLETESERRAALPPPPVAGGYCEVALNRPMRQEYTYAVPPALRGAVRPGARVVVPFARRNEIGVVVRTLERCDVPSGKLRWLGKLLDSEPVADEAMLALTAWIARRYACSWGEALAAVLPAPLKRESGARKVVFVEPAKGVGEAQLAALEGRYDKQYRLLRTLLEVGGPIEAREVLRRLNLSDSPLKSLASHGLVVKSWVDARPDELLSSRAERPRPAELTADQRRAVRAVVARLEAGSHRVFLLRGVTGSGKTEVYLRVIERALELGRSAIVLVPEIALTPQTVGWFRARFGDIAVLHSRMTDAQRLDMWRRVRRGDARVVVGARSAVFAPVPNLGVVVVDEEHEPSFKQANAPRYHARDVAVERARAAGAVCLLGSATPALESWWAAQTGRYELLTLASRIGGVGLPPVDIVDMRLESLGKETPLFSRRLRFLLAEALAAGEQSILFLNRRGFTPVLWCRACRAVVRCDSCSLTLTLHRRIGRLICHGCCEERPYPPACPSCSFPGLANYGAGSERVEREIAALLPGARVRRMDSDAMKRREDYEEALAAFGRGEVDVLVGTQMIAKGLDFPKVTVVGIVTVDHGFHLPDFRASERVFQLIAQVAGRAGRGSRPGRVVVQTENPENKSIQLAARHDHEAFARAELLQRRTDSWPPFTRIVRVVLEDTELERVAAGGERLRAAIDDLHEPGVLIFGPSVAPIALLRGRHRGNIVLKVPLEDEKLDRLKERLVEIAAGSSRPQMTIDVDAVSML